MADTSRRGESEQSVAELIEEAEKYEEQAKQNPAAVASEVPRLFELLESTGHDSDDVVLRDSVLGTLCAIGYHDSTKLEGYYPKIVEAALDTPESKVLARKLLHETVEFVARDVPLQTVANGFELVESEVVDAMDDFVSDLGTDERLPTNGATALAVNEHLCEYAQSVSGREQLVVSSSADAFEDLVMYHASQQGLDPIDALVDLKGRYETLSGSFSLGFSTSGTIEDMLEAGETRSTQYILRYVVDAMIGTVLVIAVEETADRILRAEAVLAEQIQ